MKTWQGQFWKSGVSFEFDDAYFRYVDIWVASWIRLPLLIGPDLSKQPWAYNFLRPFIWLFIRVLILFVCCQMIKCNLKGVKQCTMPAGKLFSIRFWQLFYVSVNSVRKALIKYLQRFPFTKTTIGKTYFWTHKHTKTAHVLFSRRIKGSRAL